MRAISCCGGRGEYIVFAPSVALGQATLHARTELARAEFRQRALAAQLQKRNGGELRFSDAVRADAV